MAKVKLDLDDKNPQKVLNRSSIHIAAMATPEAMAAFGTPEPSVAEYQATHDALAAGIGLVAALKGQLAAAIAALPPLVTALKTAMTKRAKQVQAKSDGNPALIPLSGFQVASATTGSVGPLPRPENVKAVAGSFPGTARLSCNPVKGRNAYLIECRERIAGSEWRQVVVSRKSRNDITGLVSGKEYAFRIAAIGAAGQGPWSDEALCRVL